MNSRKNKKQEEITLGRKIFNFPEKLNLISMFVIIVLFGVVFFAFANIITPSESDYIIIPEYEKNKFDQTLEINPFLLVVATTAKSTSSDDLYSLSYRVYPYVSNLNGKNVGNARYTFTALDNSNIMRYFIESPTTGYKVSFSHHSYGKTIIVNDQLKKLFFDVDYKLPQNDGTTIEKSISFEEEILTFSKKEFDSQPTLGRTEIVKILKLNYILQQRSSNENQYQFTFKMTLDNPASYYKINMQTWIETKSGDIVPFVGLYNYSRQATFDLSSYYEYINKDIEPMWIYTKLEYTNQATNKVSYLYNRVSIQSLYNENQ